MKPEEIQPGKTYLMDSGRLRKVTGFRDAYAGWSVNYEPILKGCKLGTPTYCLLSTFAAKALSEVIEGGRTHELKTLPEFWEAVKSKRKNFEVRYSDREFQVGDHLELREYNADSMTYTGRVLDRTVTYVLDDPRFCLPGYVILGIE